MQNGSVIRAERQRGPDVWSSDGANQVLTVGANTAEWCWDLSNSWLTKQLLVKQFPR